MLCLDDIDQPELRNLYAYWLELAKAATPAGEAFDAYAPTVPLKRSLHADRLGKALGYILLADIERPFRVRYRLIGEKLIEIYGRNMTGSYVDTLFMPVFRNKVQAGYRQMVEDGEPRFEEVGFNGFRRNLGYRRLMLPFSRDGNGVDVAMAAIMPMDQGLRNYADWRAQEDVIRYLMNHPTVHPV